MSGKDNPLFQGDIIHTAEDVWGAIQVLDFHNHRILNFGSIYEQSRMDKDMPFSPMHEYIKAMLLVHVFIHPQSVLLFGLGAGSLLRAMHRLDARVAINAIELREEVVNVARLYFGIPAAPEITISVADVDDFLLQTTVQNVDVIMSDLYRAYDMDPLQKQVSFIERCHSILSNDGWLVANFHDLPNDNSNCMRKLRELFPALLVCRVPKGNFVIYAGKQALEKSLSEYEESVDYIEKRLLTSFSGLMFRMSNL